MTPGEKFFAWLDGELSGPDAAEVEARVAADPELARLAEEHRGLHSKLKGAFGPIAEEPVPARLLEAIHRPWAQVIDFEAGRRARGAWRIRGPVAQWAAIAATLVVGFFAGTLVPHHDPRVPVTVQDGALYASASLATALDSQLASVPEARPVRIGLTYRDQAGAICRTFTDATSSGLACHDGDRWQVRGLFPAPAGQGGAYRMAAGMDPNLAALVDSTIAGDPFDSGQEKAARQNRWK